MHLLLTTYPNKPRELKKFIIGLIKSWLAGCIQKINYVKSYYMREWQLKQEEEKILLIKANQENQKKIIKYFEDNHPYETPEMLWIEPHEVNEAYEKRLASTSKSKK